MRHPRTGIGALSLIMVAVVGLAGCGASSHSSSPPVAPAATTAVPTTSAGSGGGSGATSTVPTLAPTTVATGSATTASSLPSTGGTTTLAGGSASATTVAAGVVKVVADCQTTAVEPATITVSCGDGGVVATQLQWSSWGSTSADGTGVIQENDCEPTCAQGITGSYPADIRLSGVVTPTAAGSDEPVFSVITATYTGTAPAGDPTQTFGLPTTGLS